MEQWATCTSDFAPLDNVDIVFNLYLVDEDETETALEKGNYEALQELDIWSDSDYFQQPHPHMCDTSTGTMCHDSSTDIDSNTESDWRWSIADQIQILGGTYKDYLEH